MFIFFKKMLSIHLNGKIVKFYLQDISVRSFLNIQNQFIDKYGFPYFLECLYYVRHKRELEQMEYEEACEFLINN